LPKDVVNIVSQYCGSKSNSEKPDDLRAIGELRIIDTPDVRELIALVNKSAKYKQTNPTHSSPKSTPKPTRSAKSTGHETKGEPRI
jgi:hypothetical protein